MTIALPFGTTLDRDGRRRDRDGRLQAEVPLGDEPAVFLGYRGEALVVQRRVEPHPVLGPAHRLDGAVGGPAWMSAVDWARPTAIPAIDRPAALPAGCGTMILDSLARSARTAGVAALRYAGPYPTAALWSSLAASFTTTGREDDFTADAHRRWAGGALAPIPIDFAPAPHERVPCGDGVVALAREAIEAVVVDGCTFAPGLGVRRLIRDETGWRAALVFGDRAWAEVARGDHAGRAATRSPLPDASAAPAGTALAPPLVDALAEVIAAMLPAPLSVDALCRAAIVWGDAGLHAARDRGADVVVHVGLWHHLAPQGLGAVAAGLIEALTPIARARAVAALAATAGRPPL